ncbi:hypothetical protein [Oerskovia flava]|uniref:hypothetical protein n=1 Tax=Oerskovia flava TaxID=2986422 RepID=UPI0022402D30|nr:hypothetical protein [Oerskovia sp. JB1-3-2]
MSTTPAARSSRPWQLSGLLGAVGAWSGPPPPAPPTGPYLPDAGPAGVRRLALRAGHRAGVVDALVARVEDPRPVRDDVLDPLHRAVAGGGEGSGLRRPVTARTPVVLGGAPAVQVDETTCGSAVLAVLAVAGDPVLAWWVATGERLGAGPAPAPAPAPRRGGPEERWRELQRDLKARSTRRGLVLAPWPGRFGTPPWGAASVARYADVRYTHRVVDRRTGPRVLRSALAAAAAGVPVPLFTGGDLTTGLETAVPRHVVLLAAAGPGPDPTTARGGWCTVYEPSSGMLHRLGAGDLVRGAAAGDGVRRALGGWRHVCWAVLPAGRPGRAGEPHLAG